MVEYGSMGDYSSHDICLQISDQLFMYLFIPTMIIIMPPFQKTKQKNLITANASVRSSVFMFVCQMVRYSVVTTTLRARNMAGRWIASMV